MAAKRIVQRELIFCKRKKSQIFFVVLKSLKVMLNNTAKLPRQEEKSRTAAAAAAAPSSGAKPISCSDSDASDEQDGKAAVQEGPDQTYHLEQLQVLAIF